LPRPAQERHAYNRALERAGIEPHSANPSGSKPFAACPPPSGRRLTCFAAVVPEGLAAREMAEAGGPLAGGSGELGGYSPSDLQDAYNVPAEGGAGLTIATTVAFDYPNAESDLAAYRKAYGLPPCTSESGCFQKVNQDGDAGPYPKADGGWAGEAALDLDMASAICPECKLLLVEADDDTFDNLPLAVNTAVELGADAVNDSWGAEEFSGEASYDLNFDHPGIPVVFSAGDSGYGVSYPAASPNVISVGGTSLRKDEGARGWHESAWSGTGSGCSQYEDKPPWQSDAGCPMRTVADVAAVADPKTSVSVYDTYGGFKGWQLFGGTSVAAPIVAGIEALSSAAERNGAASRFWDEGPEGKLFDVGEGRNGSCPLESGYLCMARLGYDGPTGWGTPGASRPGPPTAATYPATEVGTTDVTLNGAINPNGGETSYRFEYDTTAYTGKTRHGKSVPIPVEEIGSGDEPIEISKRLTGLSNHVVYHYRIVAIGDLGATYGGDVTFNTNAWSPQHLPRGDQSEKMLSVSCTSASFCASVGVEDVYYDPSTSPSHRPFAERWNGDEWVREALPTFHPPAEEYSSRLEDVSCGSPNTCMAVGTNYEFDETNKRYQPFAEKWNGSAWSIVPMPMPSEAGEKLDGLRLAQMHGISCVSATSCIAVGEFAKTWNGGEPEEIDTLVESWDGVDWTIQASPNSAGEKASSLFGISCVSEESCAAVGESRDSKSSQSMLFERWNGTAWSLEPGPDLVGGMRDVSCVSSEECVAVGNTDGGGGWIEVWNGSEWEGGTSSRPLLGVSCWAAGQCVAVGADSGAGTGYAYRLKGGKWKAEDPPVPPDDASKPDLALYDVSCLAAATSCTAVGWYWTGIFRPLADRLNLVAAPTVVNEPVGEVTATTAVLNASVDNNGAPGGSACLFEVAPKLAPTYPVGSVACEPGTVGGDLSTAVSAEFSGLSPDSEYVYRVLAENEGGTGKGLPYGEFRTLPAPPAVEGASAETCETNPTLCPPEPPESPPAGSTDSHASCVARARKAFRIARQAASHKHGGARSRALKRARKQRRNAVARCGG
jgi:hypothetical protein